jgi:hypothetical protein
MKNNRKTRRKKKAGKGGFSPIKSEEYRKKQCGNGEKRQKSSKTPQKKHKSHQIQSMKISKKQNLRIE